MNCDAAVYTPAAKLQCLLLKENLHKFLLCLCWRLLQLIPWFHLLFVSSYCSSELDLSYFLFLFLYFVLRFPFLCFPFPSSGLGFVLLACSVAHLSFLLSLVPHTFLQLLCRSLLLSSPSCVLLFHDRDCLLHYLVFPCHFHYTVVYVLRFEYLWVMVPH